MKKFVNDAADLVDEALAGLAAAHPGLLRVHRNPRFVSRAVPARAGKVALISGGGSGHEPLHIGFVGEGMLDAACPGAVFTSPTPDQILAAAEHADIGGGVLLIVKNYDGDVMNFDMAAELMTRPCRTLTITDDVALADLGDGTVRRGLAGTLVVEKIVGALAEAGADLDACLAMGQRVNAATRSLGLALTSCTPPAVGRPTVLLADDEAEFGVGIHGEAGRRRVALKPARELALEMIDAITTHLPEGDERVLLITNGFGATPLAELYLMHGIAANLLAARGLTVHRSLVGNYCTSLDMAGCSFTVSRLDDERTALWDAPARTVGLVR